MRPLILSFLVMLWSLGAYAQAPLTLQLQVSPDCADSESEGMLIREIRARLPDASVVLGGEAPPNAWHVSWDRIEATCAILVTRGDFESLIRPGDNARELEYAASQIAWIATMTREDPVEDPDDSTLPSIEELEETQDLEEAPADEVPEEVVDPEEPEEIVADVPLEEELFQPDYEVVNVAFSLFPHGSARRVPRFALNIYGEYYGLKGVEFGVLNSEIEFMHGAQFALGLNDVRGEVRGLQAALGLNFAGDVGSGVQLALGLNSTRRGIRGVQSALGLNSSDGPVHGVQLALGANMAPEVFGAQLGLLNLGGKVRGVQLGLLNVAESADFSLGLLSIMSAEPMYITGWITSRGLLMAGIQHGSKYLRTMLAIGGAATGLEEGQVGAVALGVSGHIPLGDSWYIDIDYLATQIAVADYRKQSHLSTLRAVGGWRVGRRLAIYAGPAISGLFSGREDGLGLPPESAEVSQSSTDVPFSWYWPEVHVGARF